MAVEVTTNNGKKVQLLNPREKGVRYKIQLKEKCVLETGKALDEKDIKFRQGYLSALNDTTDAYLHREGKKDPKKRELLKKVKKNRWQKLKSWLIQHGKFKEMESKSNKFKQSKFDL